MTDYKIIFIGPVGAGKTTAVSTLSDTTPVSTDELASDRAATGKATTTVAMDYGVIELEEGIRLHLYGTPGQLRFEFMWDMLARGVTGLVLLINNNSPDPLQDLHLFIKAFEAKIRQTRLIVGVTCMDLAAEPTLDDYHEELSHMKNQIAVVNVDARKKRDLVMLIEQLSFSAKPGMVA